MAGLSLMIGGVNAQKYTVKGVAPAGVKTVYIQNLENPAKQVDSVAVVDGQFVFAGDAAGKLFAHIYTSKEAYVPVMLEGNVTVDLEKKTATGTAENEGLTKWATEHAKFYAELVNFAVGMREKGQNLTEEEKAQGRQKMEEQMQLLVDNAKACCNENPTSRFPAYLLRQVSSFIEKEDVIVIAEKQPVFFEVSLLAPIKKRLEGWKRQAKGVMFTDLAMADTTGVERKLSEFVGKGKYVLIDFWASWCGPCRQEMPFVKAAYEKYHDKGFDIVGLSFDNNAKAWKGAINKMGLPWHHLSDLKGWDCIAGKTYGVNSIPATLLVGPDGKIIESGLRGEALEKKLAEIFK